MTDREQLYEAFNNGIIGLDDIIDISQKDGYNQALEDMQKGIKEILEDNAIYNIDCIDTLVKQLTK